MCRRRLLYWLWCLVLATSMILTACQPATPTTAVQPTSAQAGQTAAPTTAPATEVPPAATTAPGTLADIPRNRTLIYAAQGVAGEWPDFDIWNPYAIGTRIGDGASELYEPLAYYSAFGGGKYYMWLAESYEYTPDFKQLTVKTRSGINWSDGVPFSAADVAYTLTHLKEIGGKVIWGANVQQYVDSATATDANTVVIKFKIPAPRFWYWMSYKFDIGLYIVPQHIFEGQDWTTFKNFDLEKGWPVSTAPWKVVHGDPSVKIVDRTDKWWALDQGLVDHLPNMLRLQVIPIPGQTQQAQLQLNHQLDSTRYLVETAIHVVQQDPNLVTWSGKEPPYGYVDWWPISLFVNYEVKPFDNPDVRWALSYYLDRSQIVEVAYGGNNSPSILPLPPFASLKPYYDAVSDLLEQYPTNGYNPDKGDALLEKNGYTKGSDGFWADAQGNHIKLDIMGIDFIASLAPVVAEQLKDHGIDATFSMPPDFWERFPKGEYVGATMGHGGSIGDPYDTLNLYQSTSEAIPGWGQVNFARWNKPEFDKIVDQVYMTDMKDTAKLQSLFHDAMKIWLPDLPDIPLVQYMQNYVHDTTYWTGWPDANNPYVEEHNASLTWALVLMQLKPTQ